MADEKLPNPILALLSRMAAAEAAPEDYVLLVRFGRGDNSLHFAFEGCIDHKAMMIAEACRHFANAYGVDAWMEAMEKAALSIAADQGRQEIDKLAEAPDGPLH